jgi:hypothetical protein
VFDPEKRVLGSVVFVVKVQNFKGPLVQSLTDKIMVLAKEITRGVANELKSGVMEPARAARPRKMIIGTKSAA